MENVSNENNNTINRNTELSFFIIVFFVQLFLRMSDYLGVYKLSNPKFLIFCDLVLAIIAGSYLFINSLNGILLRRYSIFGNCSFFYFFGVLVSLFNYKIFPSFINAFATQSLWYAALIVFWISITKENGFNFGFIKKFISIAFIVFSSIYFLWITVRTDDTEGFLNSLYFGLCLLPIVFITKNTWFRVLSIGISTVNVVVSGKRAALLVLVLGFVLPLLTEFSGKQKDRALKTVIVGTVVVLLVYSYINARYDITIFDRINSISEDGGSGRTEIYEEVWNSFKDSSFLQKLFGHGFNSVSLTSLVGTSAHNDFLEVLYDYGIVGLVIYLSIIKKLISYSRLLYKKQSQFAPVFFCALIIFLILSMFSHLIIYPTYIVFLLLFFLLGIWDLNKMEEEDAQ